jgi:hypothetical protein
MPLPGAGLLAGLRSKTIDYTRSASIVNPFSTPTHQQPKVKVKVKNKSQSQDQSQSQSQDQSQDQTHARVQQQQRAQVKQRRGEGTAKERGLNKSVAKTTAKERGLNNAAVPSSKGRGSNQPAATTTAERNRLNQRGQSAMRSEQRGNRNAPGHGEPPTASLAPGRSPDKKQPGTS